MVETWREEVRENFLLDAGHYWYASGGTRGRCGIGFLLNERHRKHKFQPISERLGILDVRWGRKTYRIFENYKRKVAARRGKIEYDFNKPHVQKRLL